VLWLHETAADVADGLSSLNLNAGGGMDVKDVGMKVKAVVSGTSSLLVGTGEVVVDTIDLSSLILTVREELESKKGELLVRTGEAPSIGKSAGGKPQVVMKLDIEGAEYRVVPHLLDHGALCALDLIFLEWHETDTRWDEHKKLVSQITGTLQKCDTVVSSVDDESFLFDGKDFPTANLCQESH